jgi:cyclic pyranopterin phosphate synthase
VADSDPGQVRMVDVGGKPATLRRAAARAVVELAPQVAARVADATLPKGDAIAVCRVAAIMATKRTPDLLPLCHPIALTRVDVDARVDAGLGRVEFDVICETHDRTGVEMEALTGAAAAALCLYDMTKGLDAGGSVTFVGLLSKSGGKSGDWERTKLP